MTWNAEGIEGERLGRRLYSEEMTGRRSKGSESPGLVNCNIWLLALTLPLMYMMTGLPPVLEIMLSDSVHDSFMFGICTHT